MDVSQGRMLHQPTEMTQSVQQAASKVSSDLAVARGIELLKSELSCRDASVRRLQRDLLVSHQARDSQSAQLDVQGQKLWEAQRQLDESRQEVQRGQHRVQQLSRELQDSTRLTQDLQAQVERLNAERCSMRTAAPQQSSEEEVQEIKGRSWELEAELYATQSQLGRHQDGTQDTCRGADEQIQQLQEEVTRLKVELSCVSQQLQRAQSELQVQERERSSLRQQLLQTREELHCAALRAEEQRLKEIQIDELQREVDRTLALLEKDREDYGQVEELEKLRVEQDQLRDKVSQRQAWALELERELEQERRREVKVRAEQKELLSNAHAQLQDAQRSRDLALQNLHTQKEAADTLQTALAEREKRLAALTQEAESLRELARSRDQEVANLRCDLVTSQDALRQVTAELTSCRREQREQASQRTGQDQRLADLQAELTQLQHQYSTCYAQLVEEETAVSRLSTELQETEAQRKHLASQVSGREEGLLRLGAELKSAQERLSATQEELTGQVEEVKCKDQDLVDLQKEIRRIQELLRQKEEELELERRNTAQLRLEKDRLLTQCEDQQGALHGLRADVQHWQQEARGQREGREQEVMQLKQEVQEAQSRVLQERCSVGRELETARRQQRDAEEEASQKEAALRAQGAELARVKARLLEAQVQASELENRLRPMSESTDLYKHKYQACVSKLAQLESTLHSQEGALKEARTQASDRAEQALRLQAEVVVLRADAQARQAQLESGDEVLATLTRRLGDTQAELEERRTHARECEQVIAALRANTAALRRQVEEQEEAVVKVQSDLSVYTATHIHSDSEYESRLSHIQELEQALSQAQERCGQGASELSACQAEVLQLKEEAHRQRQLKESSLSEVHNLQELVRNLQAEMVCTTQTSQAEVHTLEQRTAGLEEQLETARRQCTQKEKAVQKRDTLLRQSEADLVRARDELRARAAEAERQGGVVRALEAELRRARKEKRRLEAEGAALSAHLLQVQRELTESHATCRERALELARQQERVEQLEACAAEVVHSEQDQRRLQEELEKLQHRLHSTTQDLHDCRVLLEQARGEATGSRQAQLGVQEEAATLLQETRLLREELGASKQTIGRLQEQLKDQVDAAQALSTVLSQQEVRHQETLHREQSARNRENSLQTERDQLRTDLESAKNQARVSEGRLVELGAQLTHTRLWGQQQLDSLQSTEEEMVLLKVELASVTEGYHSAVAQVEVLRAQMDLAERRMEAAATEVEELREALDEARRDTSRLHHESELVVTNVNQWVKEQKETHEKFGLRIKDQSKRIVHLTAENDHLQERVEALQAQVRRLQAEVDGRRLEVESRENVGAGNAGDSRSVSAQPHQRLAATPDVVSSAARCPVSCSEIARQGRRGEEPVSPGRTWTDLHSHVQPSEGAPTQSGRWSLPGPQLTRAGGGRPGPTFTAEVVRRVARRALERRSLHHLHCSCGRDHT